MVSVGQGGEGVPGILLQAWGSSPSDVEVADSEWGIFVISRSRDGTLGSLTNVQLRENEVNDSDAVGIFVWAFDSPVTRIGTENEVSGSGWVDI